MKSSINETPKTTSLNDFASFGPPHVIMRQGIWPRVGRGLGQPAGRVWLGLVKSDQQNSKIQRVWSGHLYDGSGRAGSTKD